MVNWLLAVATLAAVVVFGSSDALAGAYGIAVSMLMGITTLLAALIALRWGYNPILVCAVNGFFLAIDAVFLAANSVKLFEGGWFPLVLAGLVALMMLTWKKGNELVEEARVALRHAQRMRSSPASSTATCCACRARRPSCQRPSTASRCTSRVSSSATTRCWSASCIITALYEETPSVPKEGRAHVTILAPDFYRVILRYGFMEEASIPEGLACAVESRHLPPHVLDDMTVFVGHETVIPRKDTARHGAVAGEPLRLHAAQRRAHRRLLRRADPAGRRGRHRDRDLVTTRDHPAASQVVGSARHRRDRVVAREGAKGLVSADG